MHLDLKPNGKSSPPVSEGWVRGSAKRLWWTIRRSCETLDDWAQNRWFQTLRLLATLIFLWWAYNHVHRASLIGSDGLVDLKRMGRDGLVAAGIGSVFAILWADRITYGLGGIFIALVDSSDRRPIEMHPMDRLNQLLREGKTHRARRLCRQMIRKKLGDPVIVAAVLERLNDRRLRLGPPPVRIRGSK